MVTKLPYLFTLQKNLFWEAKNTKDCGGEFKKKGKLSYSHLYNHPCTVFAFAIRHLTQVKRRRSKKLLQRTKDSSNMDCKLCLLSAYQR